MENQTINILNEKNEIVVYEWKDQIYYAPKSINLNEFIRNVPEKRDNKSTRIQRSEDILLGNVKIGEEERDETEFIQKMSGPMGNFYEIEGKKEYLRSGYEMVYGRRGIESIEWMGSDGSMEIINFK